MEEIKLNTERFKDISWAKVAHTKVLMLGGLGSIGSWTALLLARAGFTINGFDFDTIEEHNLGGQLFAGIQVGVSKADAIKHVVDKFAPGNRFNAHSIKLEFTGKDLKDNNPIFTSYVITGFDNMKSRKQMFEAWLIARPTFEDKGFFIDGRMRAEGFQIYFVQNNGDIIKYQRTLFNDKDVPDEICTIKATSHVGAIIGGLITAAVANYFGDQQGDPRMVPFKTIVDLELFNFKT